MRSSKADPRDARSFLGLLHRQLIVVSWRQLVTRTGFILFLAFIAGGAVCGQEARKTAPSENEFRESREPELAKELRTRMQSDQAARKEIIDFMIKQKLADNVDLATLDPKIVAQYMALVEKVKGEDRKNVLWVKGVVDKHGWPGKSLVGAASAHDAWLLVQHADADRDFQQTCLSKMEALPKGEVEPRDVAYLTDRILVGTGKKQKYGTQAGIKDGKAVAAPIEDEERVDERRKSVGLGPLEPYLKELEVVYGVPQTPKPKENDKNPDGLLSVSEAEGGE
jgi:hypothetical protein